MVKLLLNPRVPGKVQAELDDVNGRNRSLMQDDIEKHSYLQVVLKEYLRMHLRGPLLSSANGKWVPARTMAMVNMWSTHGPDEQFGGREPCQGRLVN